MLQIVSILLVTGAGAVGKVQCPHSDYLVHAVCRLQAVASVSCAQFKSEMISRVVALQNGTWHDPNEDGVYSYENLAGHTEAQFKHYTNPKLSPSGYLYTENLHFDLLELEEGQGCSIQACSSSEYTSIRDKSINYCAMRNLYCSSSQGCVPVLHDFVTREISINPSPGASADQAACSVNVV